MENVALWHERDISHSSAERVILPDACICVDFILAETIKVLKRLVVYPENMLKNLERTGGLIFSQEILLALVDKGLTREKAYRIVQESAMEAWNEGQDFKGLVMANEEINKRLSYAEIEQLFEYDKLIERVNIIYKKLENKR
jgi:adenylosuccinate lyase